MACVDCSRVYHMLMPQIGALYGGIPDVCYNHPQLSEIEGRHAPYASPRLQPLPKSPAKPLTPKPVQVQPVKKVAAVPAPKPRSSVTARDLLRGKK